MDELKSDFFDFIIDWYIFLSVNIFPFEFEIMVSKMIIDESTVIPIAIVIPDKEKRLIVLEKRLSIIIENKIHKGIGKEMISDNLIFLKNI